MPTRMSSNLVMNENKLSSSQSGIQNEGAASEAAGQVSLVLGFLKKLSL